jgi:RNA polymerase-interacting CarD/CdnL/TRCF family regulator
MIPIGSKWSYPGMGVGRVTASDPSRVELAFGRCRLILTTAATQNLRPLVDAPGAAALLLILAAPSSPPIGGPYIRRALRYREVMRHGLPDELAELYRDLGRRPVLTYSERLVFARAQQMLVDELATVWGDAAGRIKEVAGCRR